MTQTGTATQNIIGIDTDALECAVSEAFRRAYRFNEMADLSGEEYENAFDTLAAKFEQWLAEAKSERRHIHEWNSDLRCWCGADGAV